MHSQATYGHKNTVERYYSKCSKCCDEARASNPHSGDAAGNSLLQVIATTDETRFSDGSGCVRAPLFQWDCYFGTLRVSHPLQLLSLRQPCQLLRNNK